MSTLSASRVKLSTDLLTENNKEQLDKYQCPKCDHLLQDAVQTSCGHWLCNLCAHELFQEPNPTCPRPDCDEELTNEDGRPFFPDRFVRKEISRFVITCVNRKFGCVWVGTIGDVQNHLMDCVHDMKDCIHCSEAFSQSEYLAHVDICPKALVDCPLKGQGCTETHKMTRQECIEHVTTKSGMYQHMLLLASFISNLATVSSDGGNSSNVVVCDGPPSVAAVRGAITQKRATQVDGARKPSNLGFIEFDTPPSTSPELEHLSQSVNLVTSKIGTLHSEISKKDSIIHTLQEKVKQLEVTQQTKVSENEDRDFRLSLMENSNFDSSMVWKIPQFSQRMEDARTGKYTSIFSLPFYSSRYGYKMCLRLYILGDGIGKGSHMSLFFVVMKGEFDNIHQWPFTHKVTFKLINQCGGRDVIDIFQPDPLSSSFQKPKSDMNVASGCPRFVSLNELMQGGYVVDDTVFIKVKVDTATMRHP